jgi:membrane carboxypeptidase/penicillin-binding protein
VEKVWVGIKARRRGILLGLFVTCILAVYFTDVWLATCGFDGCPSPRAIQNFQPDQGGRILDRYNRVMGRLELVRRVNVPLSVVPVFVQQAFIATEDRRFYQHGGLDWRGFFRALAANIKAGGTRQGFSTITMQVARNTFAVRKYPARSLRQKLAELRLSRLIEGSLTKQQILELYFNVIYLGNGVYGVEAASRDLFGRSVSQLNLQQAAMLAALPKAPSAYTPRRHPDRALARRNLVLGLMVKEGYVSANRLAGLQAQPLRIARDEWRPKDPNDSYALDAVRAVVDSIIQNGSADVIDLTIRTTLDRNAQIAADRAVRTQAAEIQSESGRRAQVQGAMIGIDPRNGDIRALTGGRVYERGNFNRALLAHRQPGSAFKPFVYAAAMASGYTPSSEVDDDPIDVIQGRTVWSPSN